MAMKEESKILLIQELPAPVFIGYQANLMPKDG